MPAPNPKAFTADATAGQPDRLASIMQAFKTFGIGAAPDVQPPDPAVAQDAQHQANLDSLLQGVVGARMVTPSSIRTGLAGKPISPDSWNAIRAGRMLPVQQEAKRADIANLLAQYKVKGQGELASAALGQDQRNVEAQGAAKAEGVRAADFERTQAETERHNKAMELRPPGGGMVFDPNLLTPQARKMLGDGIKAGAIPVPSLRGPQGKVMAQVINEAAGAGPDPVPNLAAGKADFTANKSALVDLEKRSTAIRGFEDLARKNMKILESTLDKIPNFGASLLNTPLRAAATKLGNEEMSRFNTARESVKTEVTKILQGTTGGSAASTDAAQKAVDKLFDEGATPQQHRAALRVIEQELTNRISSLDGEKSRLRAALAGEPAPVEKPAPAEPVTGVKKRKRFNPATGGLEDAP